VDDLLFTRDEQGFGAVLIPMLGLADSVNVALSAGILLFEARAKDGW
jgi:TrmH family RNA methyltransferase